MTDEKPAPQSSPYSSRKTSVHSILHWSLSHCLLKCRWPQSILSVYAIQEFSMKRWDACRRVFMKLKVTEVYCEHKSTFSLSIAIYSKSFKEISHFSIFFVDFLHRSLLLIFVCSFLFYLSSSIYFLYCLCACMCAFVYVCVGVFVIQENRIPSVM